MNVSGEKGAQMSSPLCHRTTAPTRLHTATHLGILRLGNVNQRPGSGVHNVEQVDNRGAVVGDGHRAASHEVGGERKTRAG